MMEPTAAEIEAAAQALRAADGALDVAAVMHTYDGDAHAALTAALPLVEARLREQIAAEIEASPREGQYAPDWHAAGRRAAKIARGR